MYAKHLALYAVSILLVNQLYKVLPVDPADGYLQFFIAGSILTVTFFLILSGLQYATEQGTRDFAGRMWNQVLNRK